MIELNRILVAVDFSEESALAVKFATAFARKFDAKLYVLHVVTSVPSTIEPYVETFDVLQRRRMVDAEEGLEQIVPSEVKSTLDVEEILEVGDPQHTIVEKAKEFDVDAIVIATKGLSGLAHVLLGSVAERVARFAPCPVFVIRDPESRFASEPYQAYQTP